MNKEPNINITLIKDFLLLLQNQICDALIAEDNQTKFHEDSWIRPEGGGGITRALEGGNVFEKIGVSFSHVQGERLPASASASRPELEGRSFHALGISAIVHPDTPYVPTSHFNVRFFLAEKPNEPVIWWFGGGFDLTPYYGFTEDCQHWHQVAKNICDPFGDQVYSTFKKWADNYFYLKHRQEPRGIGGLFYDDLHEWGFEKCFAFTRAIGQGYLNAYIPIVQRRKHTPFNKSEKNFQCYRRGRYVEFNLLYDRGTLFGLQSKGRIESILISLPPEVIWRYDWQPEEGSKEAELYTRFLVPQDWV